MNPYVLAWVVTACAGALLSSVLLVESVLDLRALGKIRNGRRIRVWGRMAQEGVRMSVHVPFAIIGILALDTPVDAATTVSVLVLLYGNVSFIANSVVAMVVRRIADSVQPEVAAAVAQRVIATADAAAVQLLATADEAASRLTSAAGEVQDIATSAKHTALNTERIADNTDTLIGRDDQQRGAR